jgi:hypothetical protein
MPDAPALPAVLSRFLLTDKVTVVTGWGSGIGRVRPHARFGRHFNQSRLRRARAL